jgi:predicted Zn-dependent protease
MASITGVPICSGEDFDVPPVRRASLWLRLYQAAGRTAMAAALASSICLAPTATVQAQADDQQTVLDTEVNEILHKECDPIFLAAGLDPKHMTIVIVEHLFNAAAANTQLIFIGTDLIEKTDNPNELIGVIAHETGHAAGGHALRAPEEETHAAMAPFLLTLGLGLLAAIAGGRSGGADVGGALMSSASYFGALGAMGYSREQEARADQAALTYLEKAGESGKGLVDFFKNFQYEEVFDEARRYRFFDDHPLTDDRIELLDRRAQELPHYNTVDPPELVTDHEIMKAKLIGFTEAPQTAFFKYKDDDHSFVARYARAIAYFRETETEKALKATGSLLADYPDNPYLWELKGQILFDAGRTVESEAAHRKSVELKPDAPLLRINLAQAIVAQEDGKRADDALVQLKKAIDLDPDQQDGASAFAYRLEAQAYDAKGMDGAARLAAAEEHFAIGDLAEARIFALRARELLKPNTIEWRRATDIVLVSQPTHDDLQALAHQNG